MEKVSSYVKIQNAAEILGVSIGTLRNWERNGKLVPYRNPINGYRLYKIEQLEEFLREIENTKKST